LCCLVVAVSSAALVLVGPDALSLDAHSFGWREVIIPQQPPDGLLEGPRRRMLAFVSCRAVDGSLRLDRRTYGVPGTYAGRGLHRRAPANRYQKWRVSFRACEGRGSSLRSPIKRCFWACDWSSEESANPTLAEARGAAVRAMEELEKEEHTDGPSENR